MIERNPRAAEELGQVLVFTGDAKGKTTCAFGLALRAAGHGLRVYVGQFTKGRPSGEITAVRERLADLVTVEQYGSDQFCCLDGGPPLPEDYEKAWDGMIRAREAIHGGSYDMVILDEINVAVAFGLVAPGQVTALVEGRPPRVELVLTGRYAHPAVVAAAGLVTEMKTVRHYFDDGVPAREGIEE